MNDIQKELMKIFNEFVRLCDLIGVKYFAAYGTLLGAIRHKGFIPWDDDMDFFMLREDYDRFIKEAPKYVEHPYYVQTSDTDDEWFFPICKIRNSLTTAIELPKAKYNQGLWIDIFPLDQMPYDIKTLKKNDKKQERIMRRILNYYGRNATLVGRIYNFFIFILYPTVSFASHKFQKLTTQYNSKNMDYIGNIWVKEVRESKGTEILKLYDKSLFQHRVFVPFEDTQISIPEQFKQVLDISYDNWMTPPPEHQRKGNHTIKILDLTKGYKEYIK